MGHLPRANCLVSIDVSVRADVAVASGVARRTALDHGIGRARAAELALVVCELATNVLHHGERGHLELRAHAGRLEVWAYDHGPGLPRPELCLRDGWSRGRQVLPDERRLGYGLGTVARLSDGLELFERHPDRLRVRAWLALPGETSPEDTLRRPWA